MTEEYKKANVETVADILRIQKDNGNSACLLVGAGTSATAGIPVAREIKEELKLRYPYFVKNASEDSYFGYMEALSDGIRHDLVGKWIDDSTINMSHLCIGSMVRHGFIDRILTTNFDLCAEIALDFFGLKDYSSYDLAIRQKTLEAHRLNKISLVHLHGKLKEMLYLNTKKQIRNISKKIGNLFEECNRNRVWIIVGYSGNDMEAVFHKLSSIENFDNGLYWVGYNNSEPKDHIKHKILNKKNTYYIKGEDSDSFFEKITKYLNIEVNLLDYYRPKTHIDLDKIDTVLTDSGKKEASYIFKTNVDNIKCIAYKITNIKTKKSYLHRIYITIENFEKIKSIFLENREINIIKTLVNKEKINVLQGKTHQFTPAIVGADDIVLGSPPNAPAMLHSQITYLSDKKNNANLPPMPIEFLLSKYSSPITLYGNLVDKQPKHEHRESKTGEDILLNLDSQKKLSRINNQYFYPFTNINMNNSLSEKIEISKKVPYSDKPEKLFRLVVAPENRCNYNCVFCCQTKQKSSKKCKMSNLTRVMDKIIDAITDSGCNRVMLTGGEPLLANEESLVELIQTIANKDAISDFWLCTNGSLVSESLCRRFKNAGLGKIVFSIGAETNFKYKKYTRQNRISLDHIIRNISLAIEAGLKVKVDIPLHKEGIQNIKEFLLLIDILKKAKVKEVAYFKIHKTKHNHDVFKDIFVDPNLITWELSNDSTWQLFTRPNGQKVFRDDQIEIIVPALNMKITENCRRKKCGDYCQGIYAAYLRENSKDIYIQSCHKKFDKNSLILHYKDLNGSLSVSTLKDNLQNIWQWAYDLERTTED